MSIQNLKLTAIAPSPTNPRKHFSKDSLAELAASIREHGILEPIIVRTIPEGRPSETAVKKALGIDRKKMAEANGKTAIEFELVAGERRWRAASIAELHEIPSIVRDLTDKQVVEIQVIENLQRADLHPLEEAEGYEALLHKHGYTIEDLCAKIGKSRSYVYGRMKLTALCPSARKALQEDRISHSVALLVARIPDDKLQAKALEECFDYDGDPNSYREVSETLQRRFMLRLADAPFDTKDAELVTAAGPCASCPKRTGNAMDLFPDVGRADICTDPKCFESKRDANVSRELAKARDEGRETRSAAESKPLFSYGEEPKSTHVDLDDVCTPLGWNHKKTWRTVLGKFAPPAIAAVDPKGNLRNLVLAEDARTALKAAGVKIEKPVSPASTTSYGEQERARAKRRKDLAARASTAIAEILPKAQAKVAKLDVKIWSLLAQRVFGGHDAVAFVAKRRGWCKTANKAEDATETWLKAKERTADDLIGYLVEKTLCASYQGDWDGRVFSDELKAVADLCGVKLERAKPQPRTKRKAGKKKK
jgi:ParB/RepB/Spo0J family partition protein